MEIFKHYRKGTTYINSNGDTSGYEPSRKDEVLFIHIRTDEYNIKVFPDAITIQYKYIRIHPTHFTIGKWQYSLDSLQSYTGYERKRVLHMYDVLNELLTECRIGGVLIDDWTTSRVIATHANS